MEQLPKGTFYGETYDKQAFRFGIITDTEYTVDKVDWHYHENAYFTYILAGKLVEGNKKETYHCSPGSLLYHNWQDPHYNLKPPRVI